MFYGADERRDQQARPADEEEGQAAERTDDGAGANQAGHPTDATGWGAPRTLRASDYSLLA